jgi:leucyl/phenylalanyl-tRNA--protein transferase
VVTDPFFDPAFADEHGLVGIGGDLRPDRLLRAYRRGIFPWFGLGDPICWWSPDPRAIFEIDDYHVPRRLARTIRAGRFTVSVDRDFAGVIGGCADRPPEETWLTPEMIAAYTELHRRGHAHSVEVWHGETLAGGVYGIAVGGLFAAESMFTRIRDASKVALVHLVERLRERGFRLLDIQFLNPHTERLGGIAIPRAAYLKRLRAAVRLPVRFD